MDEVIIATNSTLEGETTAMYSQQADQADRDQGSAESQAGFRSAETWNILTKVTLLRALEGRTEL